MKTIKFWATVAASALLLLVMFTSCDDPIDPVDPGPSKTEIVDKGISNQISSQQISGTTENGNTVTGTELSYESWIKVRTGTGAKKAPAYVSTRAASGDDGDVVTVLLKDVFHNTDTTVYVNSFEFGKPQASVSYRVNGTRRDGFVTITDSVMVYTVDFGNMSFNYLLEYEVAVYDDGTTREVMPYHKIERITLGELEVGPLKNETQDGTTYFQRQCKHTISVVFNGESYTLKANVNAQAEPSSDVVVQSEIVDSGYELVSYDEEKTEGVYKSWLEIRETWSLSGESTTKKECFLTFSLSTPNTTAYYTVSEKYSELDDFFTQDYVDEERSTTTEFIDNISTTTNQTDYGIVIKKNSDDKVKFTCFATIVIQSAKYNNGRAVYDFPAIKILNFTTGITNTSDWAPEDDGSFRANFKVSISVQNELITQTRETPWGISYAPK